MGAAFPPPVSSTFGATVVVVVVVDVEDVEVVVDVVVVLVVSTFSVVVLVAGSVTTGGSVVTSVATSGASRSVEVGTTWTDSFEVMFTSCTPFKLIRSTTICRYSLSRARECISKLRDDLGRSSTALEDRPQTA